MYYGKQNSSNSDYYNSYRDTSYQYNRKDYLTIILKILIIVLLLGLLFIGFIFISNKNKIVETKIQRVDKHNLFKVIEEEPSIKKEKLSKKIVKEVTIAKNNNAHLTKINLTQEDIANIVSIALHKMNSCKANTISDDNSYANELLSQDVDKLNSPKTIIPKSINTKKVINNNIKPPKSNHYNKIVINKPKEEKYTHDKLSELSIKLNSAIYETTNTTSSNYTKAISKEIKVRSNEMRIIVVKRGDTLSKIAKRAYGDYDSYIKIFKANPEIIKNPDKIYVGERLRIPL